MELTGYVNHLGGEIAALAEASGEEFRALVEHLSGPLESAIRMTLLDALSAAADEITGELAPGSVAVRLRGRDPEFVVTQLAAFAAEPARSTAESARSTAEPAREAVLTEDGPAVRLHVRMPEPLKAAVEQAAAAERRSVNAWLVRAATTALT